MIVEYSKEFRRTVGKLSGKRLASVRDTIVEVKRASGLADITNCIKVVGFDNIYRIRIGSYRAFFNFHVEIKEGTVRFLYLIPRGQAYDKGTMKNLDRNDV